MDLFESSYAFSENAIAFFTLHSADRLFKEFSSDFCGSEMLKPEGMFSETVEATPKK